MSIPTQPNQPSVALVSMRSESWMDANLCAASARVRAESSRTSKPSASALRRKSPERSGEEGAVRRVSRGSDSNRDRVAETE